MKRVRLGIFENSPGPSGPSRYVQALLKALDPGQWQVTLFVHAAGPYAKGPGWAIVPVCGNAEKTGQSERKKRPGAAKAWRRLAPQGLRLWAGFGSEVMRLSAMIAPYSLDLFHTQCTGCEESPLAARLAGVGQILGTFHVASGYDLDERRSAWPHRTLEMFSNRALDEAIAVSEFTRRDWMARTHLPGKSVRMIHNGVDAEHFCPGTGGPDFGALSRAAARVELGLPPDALVVGGVGRLNRIKGFDCLIRAMVRLPQIHLALAGSGPMQTQLARLAADQGVAGRVHFLGFCADVRRVYQALDVLAVPSRLDAINYALLEAMAMQLPVVGARVGGIPEVIVDGATGILVDGHNAAAWAAGLRPLLASPRMRQEFGVAGRRRVCAEFQEQDMVRRTLEVYRGMVGQTSFSGGASPACPEGEFRGHAARRAGQAPPLNKRQAA